MFCVNLLTLSGVLIRLSAVFSIFPVVLIGVLFSWETLLSQSGKIVQPSPTIKRYFPKIIAKIPHDTRNFTQGLKFHKGQLYETTGLYEESKLIRYEPIKTVKFRDTTHFLFQLDEERHFNFPNQVFAEDLEIVNDQIYVLTWRENLVYVFDKELRAVRQINFEREGWGITYNGKEFITSDGSDILTFREPKNFKPLRYLQIQKERRVVKHLNALEWVNGYIYANVWFDNNIYIINPKNGLVVGIIDCSELVSDNKVEYAKNQLLKHIGNADNVLNGITYDPLERVFYLTGKRWFYIYKIKLTH